ncbi:MmgE/PrpD family protein [Arenibaculum pallidiluteum]|uniref:MmgE/PrpD family protein n=1 Tax=Arenibaculum pallidiluteum TaxID=2812559 RepID=UPI001A956F3C|nr:MmgE/PrpD family protein [Arenibaculum pallidiluteum]
MPTTSRTPTLSQSMAEAVASFDLSMVGPAPVAKAKACLLDFLSCAFESIDLPWGRQARAVAPASGGAHIVGSAEAATPGDAAFANAVLGHGLVREDMHAASLSHHGVVVWPALLALAERHPVHGARLLGAAILGYEVGCRVGRALFDAGLARLFRPTGLVGPIGAAAGGAYLLGLDAERTAAAIAFGTNAAAGLNQWPHSGGSDMYFHPGFAARSALTAVELAALGAFGSPDILEGEAGLFAAFGRKPAPADIPLFPEGKADILGVYNKPVAACNFAQTACQAALRLAAELTGDAAPVESVSVRVAQAAVRYPGCDFQGPYERALQAKMSIQFGVAAALVHRRLGEANYQRLDDPEVLRIVRACELQPDPEFTAAFPAAQGAEVEVSLKDGRRLKTSLRDVVPATEADIRARFRESAGAVLGAERADAIEEFVDGIETKGDAGQLMQLCAATAKNARTAGRRPA